MISAVLRSAYNAWHNYCYCLMPGNCFAVSIRLAVCPFSTYSYIRTYYQFLHIIETHLYYASLARLELNLLEQ